MNGWIAALLIALAWGITAWWRARGRNRALARAEGYAARLAAGDDGPAPRLGDELGRVGRTLERIGAAHRARQLEVERERDERELVLAHMSDGAALLDSEGRVMQMNHRFAELLAIPRPASPGTPFTEFSRHPDLDRLIHRARSGDSQCEARLLLWLPHERSLRALATPLRSSAVVPAVLLVLQDLTEADRVNRMRQDFVANVSHELRTPLTSLRGYVETLLDGGLDDEKHREGFVRVLRDQTVRLQALVEDLLALAELERPDAAVRTESLDLRDLTRRQLSAAIDRANRAGIETVFDEGPPLPVIADRVRLEQAVANLIDNAFKYTERGRVTVRAGGDENTTWIEVEDTGPGIAAEHVPRVFERFYRVDPARSRERGGTGLGLSIVRHIAELHGGRATLRSAPGEGSTFRFEIPRHPLDLPVGK